jgi:uncharacterized protein
MGRSLLLGRGAGAADARERARRAAESAGEFIQRALTASGEWFAAAREFTSRAWREHKDRNWVSWVMTALIWIAVVFFCLYLGVAAILYFAQRSMMYFPETIHTSPAQAGLPEAEEVTLTTSDGERLVTWNVVPRGGKPVILYFHGNGGALRHRVERFQKFVKDGVGLIAVEYRGYGGSSGSPSEAGLIADGEAAYAFAAAHYPARQIVLWGESLGTAVAVALAAEKPVGRVILEAPFTSAAAVAATHYWYMPIALLMKDQFRSDELIGNVTAPVLILHGVHDHTVPFAMGERMFELTKAHKDIVRFLDGGHDDLDRHGALHAIGRFLAGDLDRPPVARPH